MGPACERELVPFTSLLCQVCRLQGCCEFQGPSSHWVGTKGMPGECQRAVVRGSDSLDSLGPLRGPGRSCPLGTVSPLCKQTHLVQLQVTVRTGNDQDQERVELEKDVVSLARHQDVCINVTVVT